MERPWLAAQSVANQTGAAGPRVLGGPRRGRQRLNT